MSFQKMIYIGPRNSTVVTEGDRQSVVSLPQQAEITPEEARQAYERLQAAYRYMQQCLQSFVIPAP